MQTLTPEQESWARANQHRLRSLPAPSEDRWRVAEVDDEWLPNGVNKLHSLGFIERVGSERYRYEHSGVSSIRAIWRTLPGPYAACDRLGYLEPAVADGGVGCPDCGRPTFVNERGASGLRCKSCESVSPKEAWR